MADYSTIKGFTVQSLASDPYATSIAAGTWASAGAMNTKKEYRAGLGLQTAALIAGGTAPYTGNVEEYDGTSWTEIDDLTTAGAYKGSTGITTAALVWAGYPSTTDTESYNGSTWTEVGNINHTRYAMGSAGTYTSALAFAGADAGTHAATADTEVWNGSTWTEVNNCNTARYYLVGSGTATAALAIGGSPVLAITETYDGTSWTEVGDTNTGHGQAGGLQGAGTNTSTLVFGGWTGSAGIAVTEYWNGTTWTEIADLGTARANLAGAGTVTAALAAGGGPPYTPGPVEEFSVPATVTLAQEGQVWYNSSSQVLKGFGAQGAIGWSSGGNLNTARKQPSAAGIGNTSGIVFGGRTSDPTATNVSETYDGSTWTEGNNVLLARFTGTGFGVATAAIFVTGYGWPTGDNIYTNSETYDGTSWTEGNNINVGRGYLAGCGTTTAGLAIGGFIAGPNERLEIVEDYNGTSWAEVADLSTADSNGLMSAVQGTPSAALAFGGVFSNTRTEEYDGSTWTETANLNTGRQNGMGSGIQTAALCMGGSSTPNALVESYNGSAWTETSYDLGTGRYYGAACGSSTSVIVAGGADPTFLAATEELGGAAAIKTFTAS